MEHGGGRYLRRARRGRGGSRPVPPREVRMDPLVALAEERIREAMERGEFDNLPGAGRPLVLDDDSMVPADLRVAYRILKNAGCIPPELEMRKEIITLKGLLRAAREGEERDRIVRELNARLLRFNLTRKRPLHLEDFPEYADRLAEKLSRAPVR